ncbi:hypothetical protein MRX96_007941 [Rhipicephalus microplus]
MAAVPLVVDRICKSISDVVASKGLLSKALFEYAVDYKNYWLDRGFDTPLLNYFVFDSARSVLGSRLKVLVVEAYGMTETCAVATSNDADDTSVGRVGAPVPGTYVRLVDWPEGAYRVFDKPNPRGEVVVGGPCVARGYFKKPELTREVFTYEAGVHWFYTGDIGEIFPDGTLKIIDRKKELVKLQYGEYVSLGHVETVLKTCPLVDNALVYGSSLQTYLVALVAPNHQQLQRVAVDLGKSVGKKLTLKELCEDPEVIKAATEAILSFARKSGELQKTEVPLKLKLCPDEWRPDTGLVTATFKVRRKPLQDFYAKDIDTLYGTTEHTVPAPA